MSPTAAPKVKTGFSAARKLVESLSPLTDSGSDQTTALGGRQGVPPKLSRNVTALGLVSLCMGMSSAMIHGLLPAFLVTVLGVSILFVGLIEGTAEATTSLVKIFSGRLSDWLGRRKALVVVGYGLSGLTKLLFPVAETALAILAARTIDRIGKGIRDAPRDALLADVTPSEIRGSGFGLRTALYTIGAVAGPLTAMGLMTLSGDNFRLVFWLAAIPGFVSVAVLVIGVKEAPNNWPADPERPIAISRRDLWRLNPIYWWAVSVAAILALARCSPAFLLLKASSIGIGPAFVPVILVLMNLVYSASAYPCGVLADMINRRLQLGAGVVLLIGANLVLIFAQTLWLTAFGVALWGLQMGLIQGLLSAVVADASPPRLRGTAFAIYDVAVGIATLIAGIGAGALWVAGGAAGTFSAAALLASVAALILFLRPAPKFVGAAS
jgi:MFS family permease